MEQELKSNLQKIKGAMHVDSKRLGKVADDFAEEMEQGLRRQSSSLQMLPTYVGQSSGKEQGEYIALDFGGTHVRVARVQLCGSGVSQFAAIHKAPLLASDGSYDYTRGICVEELFDFLAQQVVLVADNRDLCLGHSFSFASRQVSLSQAHLVGWTKEINVSGIDGQDVGQLLTEALHKLGKKNIRPVAVINDTTATYLATSYEYAKTKLGSVCGTGHNTCFGSAGVEYDEILAFNTEAGGFDRLPFTYWDDAVDKASENPGRQRLEKMVAGRYIGEVTSQILSSLGGAFGETKVTPFHMAALLGEKEMELGSGGDTIAIQSVSEWVVQRAASLVGATFHAMLLRLDPKQNCSHVIGMNGSLFEKMPGFAAGIYQTLVETGGWSPAQLKLRTVREGPLVGAAIAAAHGSRKNGGRIW